MQNFGVCSYKLKVQRISGVALCAKIKYISTMTPAELETYATEELFFVTCV